MAKPRVWISVFDSEFCRVRYWFLWGKGMERRKTLIINYYLSFQRGKGGAGGRPRRGPPLSGGEEGRGGHGVRERRQQALAASPAPPD